MPAKPRNQRVQITPSPGLLALLQELGSMAGEPVAGIAVQLLEEAVPVIRMQLDALQVLKDRPGQMEAHLLAAAQQAKADIDQAVFAFKPPKQKRRARGANAKP